MKWNSLRLGFSTKPLTHSSWQCSTAISLSAMMSRCSEKLERLAQLPRQLNDSVERRRGGGEAEAKAEAEALVLGVLLIVVLLTVVVHWILRRLL